MDVHMSEILYLSIRAPDNLWGLCAMYVIYISNRMAHPFLDNKTPFERRHGYTPDISAVLHFSFYDPAYFMDTDGSFPQTKERLGFFVCFAEHVGDALTYLVLDTTTSSILARSVVRNTTIHNLRLPDVPVVEHNRSTIKIALLLGHDDITPDRAMYIFNPLDLRTEPAQTPTIKDGVQEPTSIVPISSMHDVHIGSRLSVYWPDDDQYCNGIVTASNPDGSIHTIT